MAQTKVNVRGMSCEGCETVVESAVSDVNGVDSVEADRESGTVTVDGDADARKVVEAVDFAGYDGSLDDEGTDETTDDAEGDEE